MNTFSLFFRDNCRSGRDFDFLRNSRVTAYQEGWGLDAENPLAAQDTSKPTNHSGFSL